MDLKQDIHDFTYLCICVAEIYFLCSISKFYYLRVMCCDILKFNFFILFIYYYYYYYLFFILFFFFFLHVAVVVFCSV